MVRQSSLRVIERPPGGVLSRGLLLHTPNSDRMSSVARMLQCRRKVFFFPSKQQHTVAPIAKRRPPAQVTVIFFPANSLAMLCGNSLRHHVPAFRISPGAVPTEKIAARFNHRSLAYPCCTPVECRSCTFSRPSPLRRTSLWTRYRIAGVRTVQTLKELCCACLLHRITSQMEHRFMCSAMHVESCKLFQLVESSI